MKEEILSKATQLFLSLGFKSVTMDDIASDMGISKKTIYQSYANKNCLVKECAFGLLNFINSGVDTIMQEQKNPIEQLFDIKNFVALHLKDERTSPMYQLQKYFPKIYQVLNEKQFEKMNDCVIKNLNNGIEQGLYRSEIDTDFISRIYFIGVSGIRNNDVFKDDIYTTQQVVDNYLEYHIRAIATPKGITIMEQIQNK